jgi:pyruvate dehydrogenase E1 component beta subunit
MAVELKMPALSPTMEEGTLAKWLVKEGDSVKSGDILAEIETDKATMEYEAVDEGVISSILVAEGTDGVKVGTAIALMNGEGDASDRHSREGGSPSPEPTTDAANAEMDSRLRGNDGGQAPTPSDQQTQASPVELPEQQQQPESGTQQLTAAAAQTRTDPQVAAGTATQNVTVREALRDAMAEEMRRDERVFVMGEEVAQYQGAYKVTRGPNGAASRVGAQHSQNYAPWYASVPGLVVIAPYDAADAKGLLKAAIRSEDPVVFLENELLYGQHFDVPQGDDWVLPIGKARTMREGKDVTIVSYSIGVGVALEAAETLAGQGIDAEVIDLRTLRPLDRQAVLTSLAKTNRLVVVEEGWPTCSISSEIIAICMEEGFDDLDAPVMRVTDADVPLPYAANLEKLALIKAEDVVKATKAVCYR